MPKHRHFNNAWRLRAMERAITYLRRAYRYQVASGKLSPKVTQDHLEVLEAIRDDFATEVEHDKHRT